MRFRLLKKALSTILISIIGFMLLAFIFINLPFSHRFITNRVNQIFAGSDLPIHIGSISTITPGSLHVNYVLLTGSENDTIIFARNLKSSFKTFALLRKKIILPSVELEWASINFLRSDSTKGLNIAEAFTNGEKDTLVYNDDIKKKWEISVGKAELSNIRFRMTDSVSRIFINQDAGHILIEVDKMSLLEKSVKVKSLELEDATGSITLNSPPEVKDKTDNPAWDLGLSELNLKNINFIFDDQSGKLKLDLLAGEIHLKTRKTDLNKKEIDFENAEILRANVIFQIDSKAPQQPINETVVSDIFPWSIIGDKLNLADVSLRISRYGEPASGNPTSIFSVLGLEMNLTDLKLSEPVVNANIKSISFGLGNGFSLKSMSGKLDSRSGTTKIGMVLETGNSKIDISSSVDANFFDIIKNPAEIKNAELNLKKSSVSLNDIAFFMEDLKEISVFKTLAAKQISLSGDIYKQDSVISLASLSISQYGNIDLFFKGEIKNAFTPEISTGDLKFSIADVNVRWLKDLLKEVNISVPLPDINQLSG